VTWAVDHALEAGLERVWVVTGAVALDAVLPAGVEVVDNQRWAEGQATSLQAGIAAARDAGIDAVVVGLGDQPLVPGSAWRLVAASPGALAVATYDGRRRNPVRLGAEVWDLVPEKGDEGARALMRAHPGLVTEVACEGDPADIDTVEDLGRWD
jgi:CTP:molybdopterin cytidylyltransferase MocA